MIANHCTFSRNCETTSLQYKHFEFSPDIVHREGPLVDESAPFFKVNLRNRKNWQKRTKNGEHQMNGKGSTCQMEQNILTWIRTGHTYNIYPQPATPAIDMHMHMVAWLDFYARFLLKRPLQPNDYIFPTIGANGVSVHPERPLSSDMVQKKIIEMATKAGIKGAEKFTTHCFRRGGAQYRFMYAPMTKRWSLAQIRWWGGWAQGEHVSSEH